MVDQANYSTPGELELSETDPAQAERFFGNRLVQGLGAYSHRVTGAFDGQRP